jgi:undecaprenyl-diphosphatase
MISTIILGIVEGATEFVPISSSGHLIIARDILGWNGPGSLSFDAILQFATAFALLVYFWRDIWRLIKSFFAMIFRKPVDHKDVVMIFAIILGTIPAVIGGLLLEKQMETVFRSAELVAWVLIVGSIIMYFAEKFATKDKMLSIGKGFWIGLFQCLALVPGFSRSGATISGGLYFGLNREDAARFSFLLSIPIIFGSGAKKLLEISHTGLGGAFGLELLAGSLTAFVVGILAIGFLMKYLKNHTLNLFVWYRIILAVVVLLAIHFAQL